jgi:Skp family chaperone for outer membrane proteins
LFPREDEKLHTEGEDMTTKTSLLAALALAAAAPVLAQEAAAPAPAKAEAVRTPRIAVIDMARVSQESLLGKSFQAQLEQLRNEIEAERTKKQNDLQKLDAQIKALQDEIEKQQSVLSPEALDRKRQDVVKKGRDRQAFLEDGQQELQRMQERAQQQAQQLNGEFQVKIKPHIEAVAKEKGIDVLLDSQVALTVNKEFDISQEVVVKADDAERAARAKAGAAKPASPAAAAPKPAAPPAAPTPAPSPTPSPGQQG